MAHQVKKILNPSVREINDAIDEISQYLSGTVTSTTIRGNGTFAGSAFYNEITIGSTLASTSYSVTITPTCALADVATIGVVTIPEANKTVTTFRVYNSGAGTTQTFDWILNI